MAKQYPNRDLEKALRERGFQVQCNWQIPGPANTGVMWMEHLYIANEDGIRGTVIVQTFKEGGWAVYVEPTHKNETQATIDAVIAALTVKAET